MRFTDLRVAIFTGWAACAVLVLGAYVYAFVTELVRPQVGTILTSLGAIIGLLAPQLTIAYDFILSEDVADDRLIAPVPAATVLALCGSYWVIFVLLVWVGVAFRQFVPANGQGIESATSIVVAVAGTLSFLAIRPTSKLFSSPRRRNRIRRPK